jgi:hypothetical protein
MDVQSLSGLADHIELSVPARADLLHLVRFHVGAAAAHADMRLEAVEDLQLAVDELCLSLLNQVADQDSRLSVSIAWTSSTVEVVCTADVDDLAAVTGRNGKRRAGSPPRPALPAELSARVLDALVDEHGTFARPGCLGAWLRKRHTMTGQRT